MSGLVKGVKKVISKVVSGVKKVFKKVASSKIGKVILIAAAIYLGGAALGHWAIPGQSGFASTINGAWANVPVVGAGTAAPAANAAALPGSAGGQAGFAAGGQASTVASGSVAPTTGGFTAGGQSSLVASNAPAAGQAGFGAAGVETAATAAPAGTTLAGAPTPPPAGTTTATLTPKDVLNGAKVPGETLEPAKNIVQRMMSTTAGLISAHPVPAMMATSAVAGAFTPDAIDVAREQDRLEEERRKKRQSDFLIGDVDVGRPNNTQLTRNGGLLFPRGGST